MANCRRFKEKRKGVGHLLSLLCFAGVIGKMKVSLISSILI
jgi:hypothetical protein